MYTVACAKDIGRRMILDSLKEEVTVSIKHFILWISINKYSYYVSSIFIEIYRTKVKYPSHVIPLKTKTVAKCPLSSLRLDAHSFELKLSSVGNHTS